MLFLGKTFKQTILKTSQHSYLVFIPRQTANMDLRQTKLTKKEWESIEVPIIGLEKEILTLIKRGYSNPSYNYNKSLSLLSYMKLVSDDDDKKKSDNDKYHVFLFNKYFKERIEKMTKKYGVTGVSVVAKESKKDVLKKADLIRIENTNKKISDDMDVYEFVLLANCQQMFAKNSVKHFYTLTQLMKNTIYNLNTYVAEFINKVIENMKTEFENDEVVKNAYDIVERNRVLLDYKDYTLYKHQQDVFKEIKRPGAKLIFYQAPTATGKTLTPIGLSQGYKVIFVCAAKHVGLQLARACISAEVPIGVAFGCNDSEDVRLHYFAAKEYTINKKSGGIGKVDNTVGDKVQLIVSDVHSYLHAMRYMLAFNEKEKIVMYWDEPTITLDYDEHPFHSILSANWRENEIPNVILSSATLPDKNEIRDAVAFFENKFDTKNVVSIKSYECKKTIPIVDVNGFAVLPHYLYADYVELMECVEYCRRSQTILRHFDLREICTFLLAINKRLRKPRQINNYFDDVSEINVESIKLYYLDVFGDLETSWREVFDDAAKMRQAKYKSTSQMVSSDAVTLTDGPTLYLCDDVDSAAKRYFGMLGVPDEEKAKLIAAIEFNNRVNERIHDLNEEIKNMQKDEDKGADNEDGKSQTKEKKKEKKTPYDDKLELIETLSSQMKRVHLNRRYIPNTEQHVERFHKTISCENKFTSRVMEKDVETIMSIDGLDDVYKMLLIAGVGIFKENMNTDYLEIMKRLAYNQSLFMIIAGGDYIYGTNYQFCHGYIDDNEMTQEKLIQAFGRIGRTNNQLDYSIRLTSDATISKILKNETEKREVINMNRLFSC